MNRIPFELQITVNDLLATDIDQFISCCEQHESKPAMIELSRGEYVHQPMMNKVIYATSLHQALSNANSLSDILQNAAFPVKRLKIEVPANKYLHGINLYEGFRPYFEWHGKVDFKYADALLELCREHHVHLSLNALKKEQATRFVTLREFGSEAIFKGRVKKLMVALQTGGWPIIKQQSEYCVYDTNVYLDNGWLTTN